MQIGIDLGATKIESVVLDDKGQELYRSRESSPSNYLETIDSINLIVNKIEKKFNKKIKLYFVLFLFPFAQCILL